MGGACDVGLRCANPTYYYYLFHVGEPVEETALRASGGSA